MGVPATSSEEMGLAQRTRELLLVALVAIVVHAQAAWNGWAIDDAVIAAHPLLQSVRTLPSAIGSPWWYPTEHLYRPLTTAVIGGLLLAGHGAPWLPHVVNVGLHGLVALMVTRLCRRWLPPGPALGAGLFFAVLPAHVEAVVTLVATAELLAAAALLGVMLVVTGDSPPTRGRYLLTGLLSAAALASKEGGVAAPVLALAVAWAHPAARPNAWRWMLAASAGTVVLLAARLPVLGTLGGDIPNTVFRTLDTGTRTMVALALLPWSGAMLFLPVRPAINASPPLHLVQSPPMAAVVLGALMVCAGLASVYVHWRRPSVWSLGLVIVAATLAPTSNVLFASGVALSGRSVYAPSIGAALLIGALLGVLATSRIRQAAPAIAVVFLGWCAVVSWREVPVWRSSEAALRAAEERSPESYWAPMGLAYIAREEGRPDEALRYFTRAASLSPYDWEMLADAAALALTQGDTVIAERWLRTAVTVNPRARRARVWLVALSRARGDTASARRLIEDGLRAEPDMRIWVALGERRGDARRIDAPCALGCADVQEPPSRLAEQRRR
jgi:MFS family permease